MVTSPQRKTVGLMLGACCLSAALLGCQQQPNRLGGPVAEAAKVAAIRAKLDSGAARAEGEGQVAVQGTGWGTLKGVFKFDKSGAAIPVRKALTVNKDTAVCQPNPSSPPLSQALIVDAGNRGIANVTIFLRNKKPRVHPSAQAGDEVAVFDQKACIFLNHVFPVMVGQTIEIKNSDPVGHNTNISGAGFNELIPVGQSTKFVPSKAARAPLSVNCSIHPWMQAYMLPRDNGYFAVTAPDGSFEIANLPAGEPLEIQVWHESSAGPGGGLAVDATSLPQDVKWDKRGRFKIELEADHTFDLGDINVPASSF